MDSEARRADFAKGAVEGNSECLRGATEADRGENQCGVQRGLCRELPDRVAALYKKKGGKQIGRAHV